MLVLGKIFGNNVTKPEQKGCKTRAKGVVKIESVDIPIYDIISFALLMTVSTNAKPMQNQAKSKSHIHLFQKENLFFKFN